MTDLLEYIKKMQEMYGEDVITTADKINRPDPKPIVKEIEIFNEFNRRNPQADGGQLVQNTVDGSRPGYSGKAEKLLTSNQQQKIKDAFPNIKFDFTEDQKFGVKKYLESKKPGPDTRKVNKDYTKVARFIKKGFTTEMGKGLTTRATKYQKEGKRLSIADQNKIKAKFDLPEGVKEWDFVNNKYGIKQGEKYKNLVRRMAQVVSDKNPWTLAADFGSTKGWMLAQMERVWKNESKNPNIKKLTYKPIYEKINGVKRIIGFTDNTTAGKGKTYYGLNKYTKKKAGNWTKHGDWKLNQKLVDISKRSGNAPNEVITGLLKKRGFAGKVKLNDLVHFLSGTEGTSKERIKNAIVRHHNSGVAFGSATNDLSLTTQVINQKIKGIEARIRANKILPGDIETLKNNNVYVRHQGKLYGSGSTTAIGQFKQIESSVAKALETGKTFAGKDFTTKQLTKYLTQLCPKGQASGGRIGYQDAGAVTGIAKCGSNRLEQIILRGGANKTEQDLAKKILQAGRGLRSMFSLSGMFGPAATVFLIGTEAGLVGFDMISQGKTFREAVGDSVFNYALGDRTKIDPAEERYKRYAKQGFDVDKIRAFEKNIDRMNEIDLQYGDLYKKANVVNIGGPRISDAKKQKQQIISDKAIAEIPLFTQELFRTGQIPRLEKFLEKDYVEGMKNISEADRLSEIDRISNINPLAIGKIRAMEDEKQLRELKLQNPDVRAYMGSYPTMYGFASGGLANLTNTIPPESGPMSQGLRSLYNNGRKL